MPRKNRHSQFECRLCGCRNDRPCPPNGTGLTCVRYETTVEDECAFCTRPSLRSLTKDPRATVTLIKKTPVTNMKYVSRHDGRKGKGWQVRVPLRELGVGPRNRSREFTAYFADGKLGGRRVALRKALRFRDEVAAEFGLPLDSRVLRPVGINVNIYWKEKGQYYIVHFNTPTGTLSRCFYASTWGFKENAYIEARRWRDLQRSDMGLQPAPDATPTLVDFASRRQEIAERALQEARCEVNGYDETEGHNRRLVTRYNNPAYGRHRAPLSSEAPSVEPEQTLPGVEGVTLSRSRAEDLKPVNQRRWADFALNNRLQMSSGTHGKGKRRVK